LLYFAYTARIAPDRMAEVCPHATFEFIAHLPEWGLEFPLAGNGWGGGLPTARPEPGSTVWGAVYSIPDAERSLLDQVEVDEGRAERSVEAMDRTGRRHRVLTHVGTGESTTDMAPSRDYVAIMVSGSRHWSLPAGWIAGLEERLGSGL
jgi:gamma-glutamylcyclotransferase (GGCT)/AIG2-like uncharacterized protein YtfP